jgi:hypothetical protein
MLVLAIQITACGDDDGDKPARTPDEDSKSGVVAPDDAKPRGRDRATAGTTGGAGGGGPVLTEAACIAGASRFPQASPECLGCVCDTVASCGEACQDLLLCTLTNCFEQLGNGVSVVTCALEHCAAQASAPGAAVGLTEAATSLGACAETCRPPAPPPLGAPDAPDASTSDTDDAGTAADVDAGL